MAPRRLIAVGLIALTAAACAQSDESLTDVPLTSPRSDTSEPSPTSVESTAPPIAPSSAASTLPIVPNTVPSSTTGESAAGDCASLPSGPNLVTVTAAAADYQVRIFVPERRDTELLPVVLDWHGLSSNGPDQASYSGYEQLAEDEGFIVVHPTAQIDPTFGATSWELVEIDPNRDDVAFASTLIDELVADWCADPRRIYSTGMSNGGFFTARLLCEMADRIAAASSIAGLSHPDDCQPSRPVPYLAYHGTNDGVVPYNGSGESVLLSLFGNDDALRTFFTQVMPDEFGEFAADAGCDTDPNVVSVSDDVNRFDYVGCDGDTPMSFYEVIGGGHTWPGSPSAGGSGDPLGVTTDAVSATADSWAFFRQHTLPTP